MLNHLVDAPAPRNEDLSPRSGGEEVETAQAAASEFLEGQTDRLNSPFKFLEVELLGTVWGDCLPDAGLPRG